MPRPNGMRTKKLILALIAISLLTSIIVFADDHSAARPEPKIPVQFVSRPDNADLYVDGKFVGSTDVALRLPPGPHLIEVKLDQYEPWQRELTVSPDNPTRVAARLRPQK